MKKFKLHKFSDFINEETSVQKARRKLQKASDKIDKYDLKGRAAGQEVELRKQQVDYEQEKEKLKHDIENASDKQSKGAAQDQLKQAKKDWKTTKKKLSDRIKSMRKHT